MREQEIMDYANRLYHAHGDKAEHEAAQKASDAKRQNEMARARDWQRIRDAIHTLRASRSPQSFTRPAFQPSAIHSSAIHSSAIHRPKGAVK